MIKPTYSMRGMDKLLMGMKTGLLGPDGAPIKPREPKARPPDGDVGHCQLCSFDALMKLFEAKGIRTVNVDDIDARGEHDLTFAVHGPRNSIILYRLSGTTWCTAWFGKSDSDSGGLRLSGNIPDKPKNVDVQMSQLVGLHKRFMGSGRLKILRRSER